MVDNPCRIQKVFYLRLSFVSQTLMKLIECHKSDSNQNTNGHHSSKIFIQIYTTNVNKNTFSHSKTMDIKQMKFLHSYITLCTSSFSLDPNLSFSPKSFFHSRFQPIPSFNSLVCALNLFLLFSLLVCSSFSSYLPI